MRRLKGKQHESNANYTVEAALVFPIVFFIVLCLLNYTFFCYDRAKLQSEIDDITRKAQAFMIYNVDLEDDRVSRIANLYKNTLWVLFGNREPKEQVLEEYIKARLSDGYYITHLVGVDVETTVSKVFIAGEVRVDLVGLGWMNQLFSRPYRVIFAKMETTFPREEKARILQAVVTLASKIKGVDEVINKLSELIGYVH